MRYHRCLGYSGGSSLTVSHFKQYGFPMVLTFVFSRSSNTAGENVPSASFFFGLPFSVIFALAQKFQFAIFHSVRVVRFSLFCRAVVPHVICLRYPELRKGIRGLK